MKRKKSIPMSSRVRRWASQRSSQANQKVRPEAQGETKKIRRLDILRKRRRHQGKQLPKKKYRPEQTSNPLRVSLRDHKPGSSAQPYGAAEAAGHKSQPNKYVRG